MTSSKIALITGANKGIGLEAARQRMNSTATDVFRLTRLRVDHRMPLDRLEWQLFRLRWLAWA